MNGCENNSSILLIKAENLKFRGSVFEYEALIKEMISQKDFIAYTKQVLLDEYEYTDEYVEEENIGPSANLPWVAP